MTYAAQPVIRASFPYYGPICRLLAVCKVYPAFDRYEKDSEKGDIYDESLEIYDRQAKTITFYSTIKNS